MSTVVYAVSTLLIGVPHMQAPAQFQMLLLFLACRMPGSACRFPRPPGQGPPWGYSSGAALGKAPASSRAPPLGVARPGSGVVLARSRSPASSRGHPAPLLQASVEAGAVGCSRPCPASQTSCELDTLCSEIVGLLPPVVRRILHAHNMSISDFNGSSDAILRSTPGIEELRSLGWLPLLAAAAAGLSAPSGSPARSMALWRMERELRARSASLPMELHAAVGRSPPMGRTAAGPSPRQELLCLESLLLEGVPITEIGAMVDNLAMNRARAAVGPGSDMRHFRCCACARLGKPCAPGRCVG